MSGLTANHRVVVQTRMPFDPGDEGYRIQPDPFHRGMGVTPEEIGGSGLQRARSMFNDSLDSCTGLRKGVRSVASPVSLLSMNPAP